ncbi:MAG: general secretion pathway protein GspF, partial [Gammaproteobacteria bacterium]
MSRKKRALPLDAPIKHPDHARPTTRREFIAQGFATGAATIVGGSIFSLFANPRQAMAALSPDLEALKQKCGIATQGAGKIPFICFDLSGGANIAGSNVLVGKQGGQLDFLSTAGYNKLGLPGDMIPPIANPQTG